MGQRDPTLARALMPREWDAQGNVIEAAPAQPREWDAQGRPVTAAPQQPSRRARETAGRQAALRGMRSPMERFAAPAVNTLVDPARRQEAGRSIMGGLRGLANAPGEIAQLDLPQLARDTGASVVEGVKNLPQTAASIVGNLPQIARAATYGPWEDEERAQRELDLARASGGDTAAPARQANEASLMAGVNVASPLLVGGSPSVVRAGATAAAIDAPFALTRGEGPLQERLPNALTEMGGVGLFGSSMQAAANAAPTLARLPSRSVERARQFAEAGVRPTMAALRGGAEAGATKMIAENLIAGPRARRHLQNSIDDTAAAAGRISEGYGQRGQPEQVGETAQRAIERFARGGDEAMPSAPSPDADFPLTGYRGTRGPFQSEMRGPEFWSASPDTARTYVPDGTEGGAVTEGRLRLGRNMDIDMGGRAWHELRFSDVPDADVRGALGPGSVPMSVAREAQKRGYDSVVFRNIVDNGPGAPNRTQADTVYAILNSENRRAGGGSRQRTPSPEAIPSRDWSFRAKANALYDRAFAMIAKDERAHLEGQTGAAATTDATRQALQEIQSRVSAPNVAEIVNDPLIGRISQALDADQGSIRFNDMRALRTWVREARERPALTQTIDQAALARLESALTQDIYTSALVLGGEYAAQQLRRADKFYRAGQRRIQEALEPFSRGGGAQAYQRIIGLAREGGRQNSQALLQLKRSLRPDEWRDIAATVIDDLGRPTKGSPDVLEPGAFSIDQFVSNYAKLSQDGRRALFGSLGGGGRAADDLEAALANLARVAGYQKTVESMANRSRSGVNVQNVGLGVTAVTPGGLTPALTLIAGMAITGEMLTNPAFVRWLASAPKAGRDVGGARAHTSALIRLAARDPALAPLAAELEARSRNERSARAPAVAYDPASSRRQTAAALQ